MDNEKKGLYIQLYNIHGLIRGYSLELGKNADTGGQTSYVLQLAKTLSQRSGVRKVEILTRQIIDKEYDKSYSEQRERVNDKLDIVRIRCGGGKYIRKELLWDHLEEFVDKTIKYIKANGELPDVIHGHYADAGFVCTRLTQFFGIPFVHTSHSLGRIKQSSLKSQGLTDEEINKRYKIEQRIAAEEDIIFYADKIVTSTNQEAEKQYGVYSNFLPDKFVVIPPGIDLARFFPFNEKREWDKEEQLVRDNIRNQLWRFFTNLHKPTILALCRPEKRKNIAGLIQAYGEDKELQKKANLAIFAGIRKDIQEMPELEKEVLTEMLLLMDKYNLYGRMAIPKKHDVEYEVPELYRIAAETRGVFVNPAFSENFGLTLIEAAASGLPVVSTNDGGPRDIIGNLKNGLLIDVADFKNISSAIHKIIDDENRWDNFSDSGIRNVNNYYSWEAHVDKYLKSLNEILAGIKEKPKTFLDTGKKLLNYDKLMVFDIDDTLIGHEEAQKKLKELIIKHQPQIGFAVATGRTIDSAVAVLKEHNFVLPDIIISSVGSEIYYKRKDTDYFYSTGWEAHISHLWKQNKIIELLDGFDFLQLQENDAQRKFKISYYHEADEKQLNSVRKILINNNIKANFIVSHKKYIDLLPYRASKGRAVRYLAYRWNIPHENILVAGDSGNDEDMLRGEMLGIVVGQHSDELKKLKGRRRIYFAEEKATGGILEGAYYYNFFEKE